MNSTTEDGNESSSARLITSLGDSLFWTMNCAKSPTILDDGVTLIKSIKTKQIMLRTELHGQEAQFK